MDSITRSLSCNEILSKANFKTNPLQLANNKLDQNIV